MPDDEVAGSAALGRLFFLLSCRQNIIIVFVTAAQLCARLYETRRDTKKDVKKRSDLFLAGFRSWVRSRINSWPWNSAGRRELGGRHAHPPRRRRQGSAPNFVSGLHWFRTRLNSASNALNWAVARVLFGLFLQSAPFFKKFP